MSVGGINATFSDPLSPEDREFDFIYSTYSTPKVGGYNFGFTRVQRELEAQEAAEGREAQLKDLMKEEGITRRAQRDLETNSRQGLPYYSTNDLENTRTLGTGARQRGAASTHPSTRNGSGQRGPRKGRPRLKFLPPKLLPIP